MNTITNEGNDFNRYKTYSPEDIHLIQRHYYYKGAPWVAKRLGRTTRAVQNKAGKVAIPPHDRHMNKYVTVTEAAFMADTQPGIVRHAAGLHGARKRLSYGSLIDREWAEWYAKDLRKRREVEKLGWYSGTDVQRLFGVTNTSSPTRWAAGQGTWGFAFAERVRILYGMPKARFEDGSFAYAHYYNPWDIEDLLRDINHEKPLLTTRQEYFIMLMRLGHDPVFLRDKPYCRYIIPISDQLAFGPLPQAGGTWVRIRGLTRKARTNGGIVLSREGKRLADELLVTHDSPVLRSVA